MRKTATLAYGVACYCLFHAVFLYSIGFIAGFGVPKSLASPPTSPIGWAVLVNLLLLAMFAIQHSGMARPTFKAWWARYVPRPVERSTYVLFSNLAMIVMFACWQPLGGVAWSVDSAVMRGMLYATYACGWLLIVYSTILLNHFDLFGLRQVWLYFTGRPYVQLKFEEPAFYQYVRHPLYVGWLMVFWTVPTMTASNLLFAIGTTAYILVAIQLEERNLVTALPGYAEYRSRVPMLIPRPTFHRRSVVSAFDKSLAMNPKDQAFSQE